MEFEVNLYWNYVTLPQVRAGHVTAVWNMIQALQLASSSWRPACQLRPLQLEFLSEIHKVNCSESNYQDFLDQSKIHSSHTWNVLNVIFFWSDAGNK